MDVVNIGIIGAGNISDAYVTGCRQYDYLNVMAIADIRTEAAEAKAAVHDIPHAYTVDELLADERIDVVINLTIPHAHAEVSLAAVEADKHVYSEKPLAITRENGRAILYAAHGRGVRVGCAPDTFLGGGLQTCRQLIDEGAIGTPVAATAFMLGHGPEGWHPNPDFFYQMGAGPLFDMGPYYVTALVHLLGPVAAVSAMTRISFPERIITSEPHHGEIIRVKVPTHVAGTLAMQSGPIATMITSFDVWGHNLPRIEIYGSEGTLSVPDPNTFGGPVRLLRAGESTWEEIPLRLEESSRGIGVADMVLGIHHDTPHRASGEQASHVLDVMHAFYEASNSRKQVAIHSPCTQPAALPAGGLPRSLA